MKKHWNQIRQHVTCPVKHKCKFKNEFFPYQQAQHNDIISLQFDFKNLFLHPQSHQEIESLQMFHNQSMDHLAKSWKLIQIDLSFEFQVDFYEALSKLQQYKKFVLLQFGFQQYLKSNKWNI
jgi:hypothetical protein